MNLVSSEESRGSNIVFERKLKRGFKFEALVTLWSQQHIMSAPSGSGSQRSTFSRHNNLLVHSPRSLTTASYPSSFLPGDDSDDDDFDIIDGSSFSVQRAMTITRPPSPTLSFDFSIISPPSPSPDRNSFPSAFRLGGSQSHLFSPHWPRSSTRDKRYNTIHGSPSSYRAILTSSHRTPQTGKSMKCLIPRLWGALSSPTRKGRRKASRWKAYTLPSNISYADLQPLDGEEGELIDEACYVDAHDPLPSPLPTFAGPFTISLSFKLYLKP